MPDLQGLFCVRANYGQYTTQFLEGGYAAIGWIPKRCLSDITSRDQLYPIYKEADTEESSNIVIGQQVGQIARFLLEIKPGDYVITMDSNTDIIYYGTVENGQSYFYAPDADTCPFPLRRKVKWNDQPVRRSIFSVPFQNTIRSSLTVFAISQKEHFFETIGRPTTHTGRFWNNS